MRHDLSGEAIRLGRLLIELLPEPEAVGLLALMLLQDSRRAARTSPTGDLILLEDQDRSLWNRDQIAEGVSLVDRALSSRRVGPYTLQAAIAAVHAQAASPAATDWAQIVALYDVLMRADPSPVVELNRAVAVAMRDGPWRVLYSLTPSSRGAIWVAITWRIRRGRISAGDWGEQRKPEPPTNGPSALLGWSRSSGFSSDGWPRCLTRPVDHLSALYHKSLISQELISAHQTR